MFSSANRAGRIVGRWVFLLKKGLRDLLVTWRINTILRKASGNKPISGSTPVRFEPYSDFRGSRKKPIPSTFRFTNPNHTVIPNCPVLLLLSRCCRRGQPMGSPIIRQLYLHMRSGYGLLRKMKSKNIQREFQTRTSSLGKGILKRNDPYGVVCLKNPLCA